MSNQTQFPTIKELQKRGVLSERELRKRLAEGRLPGFYCGKTFRVNVPILFEMIDKESIAAIQKNE